MPESDAERERRLRSGGDFWQHVRPLMEKQFNIEIMPLELLQDNKVTEAFDKAGMDAFYIEQRMLRGLGNRMRYSDWGGESFTFRYAPNDEYARRKAAIGKPHEHILFPHLHIESFLNKKNGTISWSYAAKTRDIIEYIMAHEVDLFRNAGKKEKVRIEKLTDREVVVVPIAAFAEKYALKKLG